MAKKFTQQEVEKLIAGLREAYDIKIRQLNYRLEGLVGENRSLRASLAEYKNKESKVSRAIVAAEEKGEEIKAFYRMSAETEWKTLRLFADKWKRLAAQMEELYPARIPANMLYSRKIFRRCSGVRAPLPRRKRRMYPSRLPSKHSIRRPSSKSMWKGRSDRLQSRRRPQSEG